MNIAKLETKLPEFIKKRLTPVSYSQKAIIVNSDEDLKKGKEIVKEISSLSKSFKEYISPIKKMFDTAHDAVTSFEKENLAAGKKIADEQEKENSDYNRRVFECQQKKENYLKDFASVISKIEQNFSQGKLNFEAGLNKKFKEAELAKIEAMKIPVSEKIDAIEEARKEIESLPEPVIVPQIEIQVEKVALKKDTRKEVKTFFIKDENKNDAIKYILKNHFTAILNGNDELATFYIRLLSIDLSKKAINEALKDEEFQGLSFVSYTSEYK